MRNDDKDNSKDEVNGGDNDGLKWWWWRLS